MHRNIKLRVSKEQAEQMLDDAEGHIQWNEDEMSVTFKLRPEHLKDEIKKRFPEL